MSDPLAQYRRTSPGFAREAATTETEEYQAFGTKDKVNRLRIRSNSEPVHSPGYNILLNIISDPLGTHFILVYSVMVVMVRGKNLEKLVFALENEQASYIQQFDSAKWGKVTDAKQPIINTIEIRAVDGADMGGKTKH